MRSIVFLCLLMLVFGISGFGQKTKTEGSSLPADIADWSGKDALEILDNPVIKTRLKQLLGEKNYESFLESFETATPIEKRDNFLFFHGCMIHACTHLESAIAIDPEKNTIHAAIFNETEETKYFNERESSTPESILYWARRLEDLKYDGVADITEKGPEAFLFDKFKYQNEEEMMVRIDSYLNDLQNDPASKPFIVLNGKKAARTAAERKLKAYIKRRGVDVKSLILLTRDSKSATEVELWLVPEGAEPPAKSSGQ